MSDAGDGADPTDVRAIAVSADDVVTALEACLRGGRRTVLRVTPPFSGRMRARIHVERGDGGGEDGPDGGGDDADGPPPLVIHPTRLVPDPPAYPDPDETADRLRAAEEYSTESHHERHARRVEAWRRAVRASIVDTVTVETTAGDHEVAVSVLG